MKLVIVYDHVLCLMTSKLVATKYF